MRTGKLPDYASHIPHFAWKSADVIKRTFDTRIKYIRTPMSTFLKRYFRSPFSALNVHRNKILVATENIYSDVLAVASGATQA